MEERIWRTSPLLTPAVRRFGLPEARPTNILTGLLVTGNWGIGIGTILPVEVGDQSLAEMLAHIARVNESRGR